MVAVVVAIGVIAGTILAGTVVAVAEAVGMIGIVVRAVAGGTVVAGGCPTVGLGVAVVATGELDDWHPATHSEEIAKKAEARINGFPGRTVELLYAISTPFAT